MVEDQFSIRFEVSIFGEDLVKLVINEEISPLMVIKLVALEKLIRSLAIEGIYDLIIAYRDLTIFFNPLIITAHKLSSILTKLQGIEISNIESREFVIPVQYGGADGPDLDLVAEYNKLTPEEVINIHSSGCYLIHAIGFTPGFPYLGGLSEKINIPRKKVPRKKVPAGSVGIGGNQTGVYPFEGPGGWNIIGKTELAIFNHFNQNPCLFQIGDTIKFKAI